MLEGFARLARLEGAIRESHYHFAQQMFLDVGSGPELRRVPGLTSFTYVFFWHGANPSGLLPAHLKKSLNLVWKADGVQPPFLVVLRGGRS